MGGKAGSENNPIEGSLDRYVFRLEYVNTVVPF